MSKNRFKLTNDDLKEAYNFRSLLNIPDRRVYCNIYGKTYFDTDGNWLFETKEDLIETFMTSDVFKPLWNKVSDIVLDKFGYLLKQTTNNNTIECKNWYRNSNYMEVHNKIEDCINYYKEVLINRMIRKRVIIFHYES